MPHMDKKPREVVGCWDNGGETADRYTVAIEQDPKAPWSPYLPMLGMSADPTHPQGISQWSEGQPGPHLGRKLAWRELPANIRIHVIARLRQK